jgi:hypothetical protein
MKSLFCAGTKQFQSGNGIALEPVVCGKAKWIKVFKRKLKSEGVFENVTFWAETCWRENTDGKHSVLTPKQAAIQLSHWLDA